MKRTVITVITVITGAASGLGLAMAKKYASEGWAVCVADIQDEVGRKIAAQLKEQHSSDCFFSAFRYYK